MIARGCGYTIGTCPSKEEQGLRCWQSTCRRNRKDSHFEGPPSCHPFLTFTGYLSALTTSAFPWSCHSFIFYPPASSAPILFCAHLKTFFFSPLILDSWVHHLFTFLCSSCFYPSGSFHFFYPPSKYLSHLFVSILCSTNFLFTHILFIPQILILSSS